MAMTDDAYLLPDLKDAFNLMYGDDEWEDDGVSENGIRENGIRKG